MPTIESKSLIQIIPSGDTSGRTDAVAIQDALDRLQVTGYYGDCGAVVLSGTYWINRSLFGGARRGFPVVMQGAPRAQIHYVGPASSGYVITMQGYDGRGWIPVFQDLTVNANFLCRGVFCQHLPNHVLFQRCYIRNTVEVAIDAISCWESTISHTTCKNAIGIGLRTRDFNIGRLESFNVVGYGCYHNAGLTTEQSKALWKHEIAYGKDKTEKAYGDSYVQRWPNDSDASVLDISGNVVQTTPQERAGVILHGKAIVWDGGSFENSKYCEYPNIYIQGGGSGQPQRGDSGLLSLDRIWMESASNRHARIIWQGDEHGQNTCHKGLTISRCYARDETQPAGTCRTFLELRGRTENTRIRDCYQQPSGLSVVRLANGSHSAINIDGVVTYAPTVSEADYIET